MEKVFLYKEKPGDFNRGISEDELIKEIEEQEFGRTDRERIVKSRVGQGILKKRLLNLEGKCKICNIDNAEFLRASHSKPWRESNNQERLDPYNGFLLCPALDILYDKGYINFEEDGSKST